MGALVKEAWINAATAFETTDAEEVTDSNSYAVQAAVTGAPSAFNVWLEGSLDGTDWFTLLSFNVGAASPHLAWSIDTPVKYIRMRCDSPIGGTAPTMTATALAI